MEDDLINMIIRANNRRLIWAPKSHVTGLVTYAALFGLLVRFVLYQKP